MDRYIPPPRRYYQMQDDNNNSPTPTPSELQDQVQDDGDIHDDNTLAPTQAELQYLYQPPVSCIALTDINPARPDRPRPRSILVVLRMPQVPFIVNRVVTPGNTTTAVTCGAVPLSLCNSYYDFIIELSIAFYSIHQEVQSGSPSLENPIPGYEFSYEMMGPVERRVTLGSHSWEVFKARVRLVILRKL